MLSLTSDDHDHASFVSTHPFSKSICIGDGTRLPIVFFIFFSRTHSS